MFRVAFTTLDGLRDSHVFGHRTVEQMFDHLDDRRGVVLFVSPSDGRLVAIFNHADGLSFKSGLVDDGRLSVVCRTSRSLSDVFALWV